MLRTYETCHRGIIVRIVFGLLLALIMRTGSPAQAGLAISGVVRNQQGAPVAGAAITVTNSGAEKRETRTDSQGSFEIGDLAPGTYAVQVSYDGLAPQGRSGIELATAPVRLEFVLERASGGAQPGRISELQLAGLPLNGRSYSQLATLQAGIADTSAQDPYRGVSGGNLTVAGGRPNSNVFLLDGTNIMDTNNQVPRSAGGVQLGSEAVYQVQVFSTTVPAEYGRGSGGILNSITRSGSNDLHGTLFEYFRNNKLDAPNRFDQGFKPPFKRNQFGFLLTGPIRKERTFFLGAFEAMRDRLTITETSVLPSAQVRGLAVPIVRRYLDLYPVPNSTPVDVEGNIAHNVASVFLPTNDNYFSIRVDHKISDRDSFFARYTFDDATGTSPQELYLFRTSTNTRQQYLTLVETHFISLQSINSFRASFTRPVEYIDTVSSIEISRSLYFVPDAPNFGQITIPGLTTFGPSYTMPEGNKQTSFQFADDVVLQRGAHAIKFGADIHRYRWDVFNSNSKGGVWSFNSLDNFLAAGPVGTELTVALPGSDNKKAFRQTLAGFYIQDGYRATARLRLDLGLRYEAATIIQEKDGRISFLPDWVHDTAVQQGPMLGENPSLLNFSPRFGFSWSPLASDQFLVNGGLGMYYDPILEYPVDPLKNSAPYYKRVLNPNFDATRVFPDAVAAAALVPAATPFGIAALDYPHITNPVLMRYTLSLQRPATAGVSLGVSYVGARGNHLFRGYEANLYPVPIRQSDGSLFFPPNAGPINPAFSSIGLNSADAQSFYNALQLTAALTPRAGFSAQGNYTFSKSVDDASVPTSGASNNHLRQYPLERTGDRGLSEFDIRHRLSVNYFYALPFGAGQQSSGLLRWVAGGWRIGGVFSFRSGTPFHPLVNIRTQNFLFSANRPNLRPGADSNSTDGVTAGCDGIDAGQPLGGSDRYFDPCAFSRRPPGTLGTAGRNIIIAPSVLTMDLSLQKEIVLGGDKRLQFRAEIFNVPNHPNLAPPPRSSQIVFSGSSTSANPTAGAIYRTISTSRQMQFALRLSF